jgi:hypothetical protein
MSQFVRGAKVRERKFTRNEFLMTIIPLALEVGYTRKEDFMMDMEIAWNAYHRLLAEETSQPSLSRGP